MSRLFLHGLFTAHRLDMTEATFKGSSSSPAGLPLVELCITSYSDLVSHGFSLI